MKLLLDQNISIKLIGSLSDVFPDSAHVSGLGLGDATDSDIMGYAVQNGYAVVTKDSDFEALSLISGNGAKVILLGLGNCPSKIIEQAIRFRSDAIREFLTTDSANLFHLHWRVL